MQVNLFLLFVGCFMCNFDRWFKSNLKILSIAMHFSKQNNKLYCYSQNLFVNAKPLTTKQRVNVM